MKKFLKKALPLALIGIISLVSLVSCQGKEEPKKESEQGAKEEKKTIKLGAYAGPYDDLFRDAIKPILEKKGYTVEETTFSDFRLSNVALAEGSVDFNVSQHSAYMNAFNENEKSKLTALTHIPTVPAVLYPGKSQSLDSIKSGAKVAIPQDAANAARALALLQKAGWIKIKDGVELMKSTVNDVVENKNNIEFVVMDSGQIPRVLDDVDYAVIPGSIIYNSKMDTKKALLSEDVLKDLELILVVDEKNKDTEWAKDIKDAYNSDEFKAYMEKNNKDNYWFIPSN